MKKNTVMVMIAKRIEKIAHEGAGKMCISAWHQPKVPTSLKLQSK